MFQLQSVFTSKTKFYVQRFPERRSTSTLPEKLHAKTSVVIFADINVVIFADINYLFSLFAFSVAEFMFRLEKRLTL